MFVFVNEISLSQQINHIYARVLDQRIATRSVSYLKLRISLHHVMLQSRSRKCAQAVSTWRVVASQCESTYSNNIQLMHAAPMQTKCQIADKHHMHASDPAIPYSASELMPIADTTS